MSSRETMSTYIWVCYWTKIFRTMMGTKESRNIKVRTHKLKISIKVFWSDWNTFWTFRTVFRALYTFFEYRHFSTEIQNSLSKQCAPWVLWSFHLEFSATPHLNKNLRTQKYSFRRCVQFFCELLTFIIREDRASPKTGDISPEASRTLFWLYSGNVTFI